MADPIPYTIRAIIEQLGPGIRSALIYCGADKVTWRHPVVPPSPGVAEDEANYSHRPAGKSFVDDKGQVQAEVALFFTVNGSPDELWRFTVAYEWDDTYTVYFVICEAEEFGRVSVPIVQRRPDVYCDDLQNLVCEIYDEAIQTRRGGFIHLG